MLANLVRVGSPMRLLAPSRHLRGTISEDRVARKPLIWIALLCFVAVPTLNADSLPDFSALVDNEGPAVVKITVETESAQGPAAQIPGLDPESMPEYFRRFFEQMPQNPNPEPRRGAGFGSGFIMSDDGYVITNAHVVSDAVDIRVGLNDRREFKAELIGADPGSDIALLKIDSTELPVVSMGDSDELTVGEWVLAIGSPFGFEHTATQGIVSALSRSLPDDTYVPFIQTDVAVNPGNSGGPLFNTDGEVVGVNSQIYSRSGGYQGLSFAIPINVALGIAEQLKDTGFATRGWLGVTIQNVDQALAESFGLNKPEGALVAQVGKESPAAKGGIESGDIILKFNGKAVPYSSSLPPLVGTVVPGDTVPVDILRDGDEMTLDVTIEALKEDGKQASAADAKAKPEPSRLGALVNDVPAKQLDDRGIDNGVLVEEVDPEGPAGKAGVRPGDLIISLNKKPVTSASDLDDMVAGLPAEEPVPMLVQRENSPIFMALKLPPQG